MTGAHIRQCLDVSFGLFVIAVYQMRPVRRRELLEQKMIGGGREGKTTDTEIRTQTAEKRNTR